MCGSLFSAPKVPPPIQIPTPEPTPAAVDRGSALAMAAASAARRQRVAAQKSSTLATGGQGLIEQPTTTNKQLFGQ